MEKPTFDDRLEEDFQWPEIGDTLFSQGTPVNAAFLERHPDYRSYRMTRGYKLAAPIYLSSRRKTAGSAGGANWFILSSFAIGIFWNCSLKDMLEKYGPMANVDDQWKRPPA